MKEYDYEIGVGRADWEGLKKFLLNKRDFLLRLLENPNLLEHESFTELLRAVFHLTEELGARRSLEMLPDTDYRHLAGDSKRVYKQIVGQWIDYMKHIEGNYPYLFSLVLRMNPFDQSASPVVREVR